MSLGTIEDRVVEAFPPTTATLAKNTARKGQKVWAICGQAHRSNPMGFVLCVYEGTLFDMKGSTARVQFEGEELAEYPRSWVLGEELPGMEVVPHDAHILSVQEDGGDEDVDESGKARNDGKEKGKEKLVALTSDEIQAMATQFWDHGGVGLAARLDNLNLKTLTAIKKTLGLAVHTSKGRDHLINGMKRQLAVPPIPLLFAEEATVTFQTDLMGDLGKHKTKAKQRTNGAPNPPSHVPCARWCICQQWDSAHAFGTCFVYQHNIIKGGGSGQVRELNCPSMEQCGERLCGVRLSSRVGPVGFEAPQGEPFAKRVDGVHTMLPPPPPPPPLPAGFCAIVESGVYVSWIHVNA